MGLARRILGDGGEAEEVLQEVFLFAWRAAPTFDPSRGNVLTWLVVATRSRSIDRLRARRPASRPEVRSLEEIAEPPAGPTTSRRTRSGREWESSAAPPSASFRRTSGGPASSPTSKD